MQITQIAQITQITRKFGFELQEFQSKALHFDFTQCKLQAQGKFTRQTGQVILCVKMGKNFAKKQSKAHIAGAKIGKK